MKSFNFHQTTEIRFGCGRIQEIGKVASKFGTRVLLVTTKATTPQLEHQYQQVIKLLEAEGLKVSHFDGVIPNPTLEVISSGAQLARASGAQFIIGLGGGSSMDAAKAISVEATHEGSAWDYLFYKTTQPDASKLLPVVAVSTTSGTGSHVTQVSVITNTKERNKSALYNNILYPKVSIVDPEMMITVPEFFTATTGFDVMCHAFESIIHPNTGAYVDLLAWEAISLVVKYLPKVLTDLSNVELREKMAWADTLAGLCIANAGVTLPHGMAMAIGGLYPHVAHGEALAIVYPAFAEFTWEAAIPQFSKIARIFNPELMNVTDFEAASKAPEEFKKFLEIIKLRKSLKDVGMPVTEITKLATQSMVLPDYKGNPRVATENEMIELVKSCY